MRLRLARVQAEGAATLDGVEYRNKIGLSVAIEALQETLRQRKATPGEFAQQAERGAVCTVIRPYLEALTAKG